MIYSRHEKLHVHDNHTQGGQMARGALCRAWRGKPGQNHRRGKEEHQRSSGTVPRGYAHSKGPASSFSSRAIAHCACLSGGKYSLAFLLYRYSSRISILLSSRSAVATSSSAMCGTGGQRSCLSTKSLHPVRSKAFSSSPVSPKRYFLRQSRTKHFARAGYGVRRLNLWRYEPNTAATAPETL